MRISILIPVVLVASTLVCSAITYDYTVTNEEEEIRVEALSQLNIDLSRLQKMIDGALSSGAEKEAGINIALTAMDETYEQLMLVGPDDVVISANRMAWEGEVARAVSHFSEAIAHRVRINRQPEIFFDSDSDLALHAYYPVVTPAAVGKGGFTGAGIDIIFSEVSLKRALEEARATSLQHSLLYSLLMAVCLLFIGGFIHVLVSMRLQSLGRVAAELSKGNFDVVVDLRGHDEIAALGVAFDDMVQTLRSEVQAKDLAQAGLVSLNGSLEKLVDERASMLREAQRIARIGNWTWNLHNGALVWSEETYRMFGIDASVSNITIEDFFARVHPDDLQMVQREVETVIEHRIKHVVQHRILLPDGEVRWVREDGVPKFDENGQMIALTGIVQEVSDQVRERANQERLETQLRQAQKMEALGQLTGGVAHDFNNLLASIRGFTELAMRQPLVEEQEKIKSYLEYVLKSSNQAAELVAKMLTFSRKESSSNDGQVINVNKMINEFYSMVRSMIPVTIDIKLDCAQETLSVLGSATLLEQVLINLCVNAKDAIADGQGVIAIRVRQVDAADRYCSSCHRSFSGNYVEIAISDDGSGISQEVLDSMFEPFFTTKDVGKGTGMGLAMVHGIVHKHNGHIVVESTKGKGTTFRLMLPATRLERLSVEAPREEKLVEVIHDAERFHILVVDDDPSVSAFVNELLIGMGYRVTVKNSSREALDYFRQHAAEVDLVITDYTMPEMHGTQLAFGLARVRRDIPIILCTGYSERVDEEKAAELNFRAFVRKPIDIDVIRAIVQRELLGKARVNDPPPRAANGA